MRSGQSTSCTICSLMQPMRKSRPRNQSRSLSPPTADTSLGSQSVGVPCSGVRSSLPQIEVLRSVDLSFRDCLISTVNGFVC